MPVKLLMTSQSPSSSLHLLPTVIRVGCSHDNVTWTARVAVDVFSMDRDEVGLSYLPLSHIAAAMMDLYGASRCVGGGTASQMGGSHELAISTRSHHCRCLHQFCTTRCSQGHTAAVPS